MRHITFAILSILLFSGLTHAQTATPTATPSSVVLEGIFEGEAMTAPNFTLTGSGFSTGSANGRTRLLSATIGDKIQLYTTAQWLIVERLTTNTVTNFFRTCYGQSSGGSFTCNANVGNGSAVDQYQTIGFLNPYYPSGVVWQIENRGNGVATNTNFHLDKIYLLQGSIVVYPTPTPQPTATPQFTATPYTVTPQPTATPAYTATPQPYLVMVVPFVVTAENTQEAMSVDGSIADYVEATDELGSPVVLGRVDRSLTGGDIVIIMLLASLLLVMLVLLGVTLWRN